MVGIDDGLELVGLSVGRVVGCEVVGLDEGCGVVGFGDGCAVGFEVGLRVGFRVGLRVGFCVGDGFDGGEGEEPSFWGFHVFWGVMGRRGFHVFGGW